MISFGREFQTGTTLQANECFLTSDLNIGTARR